MAVVGPLDKALRGFPFVKNADDYVDEGNGTDEETGGHEGDNADYEGEEDHPHSPELAGGDPSGRHGSPDPQSQPPSSGSSQTSSQGSPADTNEIERASDVPSCETGADTSGKVERPRGNTYPNTDASGTVTRPDNSFTVSGSRILKHTRIMLDTTEDSSPKPSKNTIRLQGNTTGESVDEMSQTCFNHDRESSGFKCSDAGCAAPVTQETMRLAGSHKSQSTPELGAACTPNSSVSCTCAKQVQRL